MVILHTAALPPGCMLVIWRLPRVVTPNERTRRKARPSERMQCWLMVCRLHALHMGGCLSTIMPQGEIKQQRPNPAAQAPLQAAAAAEPGKAATACAPASRCSQCTSGAGPAGARWGVPDIVGGPWKDRSRRSVCNEAAAWPARVQIDPAAPARRRRESPTLGVPPHKGCFTLSPAHCSPHL